MAVSSSALGFAIHPHPRIRVLENKTTRPAAVSCCATGGVNKERGNSLNLYKVLSLESERTSTLQEIKKAYRSLAQQLHPDCCPAEKREEYTKAMVEVNRAYEVLSDPVLRANHDAHLGMAPEHYLETSGNPWRIVRRRTWEMQLIELERRSALRELRRQRGASAEW